MLKKLQNILFEDEEIIEEDFEDEQPVETPKKEKKKKKQPTVVMSEPEVVAEPVVQERPKPQAQPQMSTRIDVTQQIERPVVSEPVQEPDLDVVFKPVEKPVQPVERPVQPVEKPVYEATPTPVYTQVQEPIVEPVQPKVAQPERPKSIGLTVDDLSGLGAPKKEEAPVVQEPQARKQQPYVYEFQPVISPIFGVDEKDLDAVQITGKAARASANREDSVSNVISPMYGVAKAPEEKRPLNTTEIPAMTHSVPPEVVEEVEDDVPEFSLDDILRVRDDEFSESLSEQASLFGDEPNEDDVDQTRVFNFDDVD